METPQDEGGGQPLVTVEEGQAFLSPLLQCPKEVLAVIASYLDSPDFKTLLFVCHYLSSFLQPRLVERDIAEKAYNSLFWACLYGEEELAKLALQKGADPNVVFVALKGPDNETPPNSLINGRLYTERRVFPTKTHFGKSLVVDQTTCSALVLATKQDHVGVIQLLIDNGATPDILGGINTISTRLWIPPHARNREQAPSEALGHIRSVSAAKILLESHPEVINDIDENGLTALETVLKQSCPARFYRHHIAPPVTETQVCEMVSLLLSKGAQARRRTPLQGQAIGPGLLLLALQTKCLRVVEIVLKSGQFNVNEGGEGAAEVAEAFHKALSGISPQDNPGEQHSTLRLIRMLLEAGISPNEPLRNGIRPLSLAVSGKAPEVINALIDAGADVDLTEPGVLHPLAADLYGLRNHLVGADEPITTNGHRRVNCIGDPLARRWTEVDNPGFINPRLLETADVNGRSCFSKGFTPLMLAASDMIKAEHFETLLKHGADPTSSGRLRNETGPFSVLRCILQGFPPPQKGDKHEIDFFAYEEFEIKIELKDLKLRKDRRHHIDAATHKVFGTRRHAKLTAFIKHAKSPNAFYTARGKHILNWAIGYLHSTDLEWAAFMLAPHYWQTKRPRDQDLPLYNLLSPSRVMDYLEFGTLEQTYRIAEMLIKLGCKATDAIDGNTILHNLREQGILYKVLRDESIRKLLKLFLDHGADLYALDDKQRTPFGIAKYYDLLELIPQQYRDPAKEN
ncbi:hypothetical protein FZEAL_10224 [Fusarium zealandicum]|uniref:F-box domain-containing protein n=1 Tax=Fusarium zealandicum TaxID=1053134 RepID=A0A8H4XCS6_9HYPO|nr:hypothetical protein FZEAL_10224 [Fusarium zealandicum]